MLPLPRLTIGPESHALVMFHSYIVYKKRYKVTLKLFQSENIKTSIGLHGWSSGLLVLILSEKANQLILLEKIKLLYCFIVILFYFLLLYCYIAILSYFIFFFWRTFRINNAYTFHTKSFLLINKLCHCRTIRSILVSQLLSHQKFTIEVQCQYKTEPLQNVWQIW